MQGHVEDGKPTKTEIENIAKRIEGNASHLAREMEMEYNHSSPEYTLISDWVVYGNGTRYKLAEHLRNAGLTEASTM